MIKVLNCCVIAILVFLAQSSLASDKLNVVTEEWRPFNYTGENGEITGIATKRLKAVLDSINIDYDITSYPWARSMVLTANDENTLIYTILRTEDRENLFQWVCPLIGPIRVYLYKLSERKDINVNTITDAQKYITSIEKSESDHEFLLSKGFQDGVNLDVTRDPYAGARKFFAGRVDLVLQTEWEMSENLRHFKYSNADIEKLIEVKKPSDSQGCLAFGLKTDKALVDKVRQALREYNRLNAL